MVLDGVSVTDGVIAKLQLVISSVVISVVNEVPIIIAVGEFIVITGTVLSTVKFPYSIDVVSSPSVALSLKVTFFYSRYGQ